MTYWDELNDIEKENFLSELEEIDYEEMDTMWRKTCERLTKFYMKQYSFHIFVSPEERDVSSMEPVEESVCESVSSSNKAGDLI